MRTQYRMRSRVVASAAAAAMAASMVVAAPGAAFATYDTGSIKADASQIEVVSGAQVNLADYFTYSAEGGNGEWHVDYKVTSGSAATVNKHSGLLTASDATGSVVVTAYLTGIATPVKNPSNPCGEAKESATITVSVIKTEAETETVSYGYQGVGNTIKMESPTITKATGSNATGWINTVENATSEGGYYKLSMKMTNGFKDHNTAAAFMEINKEQIEVTDSEGAVLATLSENGDEDIFVSEVDNATKSFTVCVSDSLVESGSIKVVFKNGFRGNSETKVLGTTVTFVI